ISHLDPDHCVDLAGLRVWRKYHPHGQCAQIPLHAPAAGEVYVRQLAAAGEDLEPEDVLVHHPWQAGEEVEIGPFRVVVERVNHPVEAYGMRISGPSSRGSHEPVTLCFSGDTD